jgi:hypothetical protein
VVVVAVLTLEIVEMEEDAKGRAWRFIPWFRIEALESLALSPMDLPSEGREGVLLAYWEKLVLEKPCLQCILLILWDVDDWVR